MNKIFNLKQFEDEMKLRFEKTQHDMSDPVVEAALYALFSGGKRLRPALMQMSYQLFTDAPVKKCRPFQFAIEMIHSYSLIHDDLPAMDDDTIRRGKPCCHIVHGEASAILAGDLLLNSAYEIMTEACLADTNRQFLSAMHTIATAAGGRGMILGQSRDIAFENRAFVSSAEIEEMQNLKTSALFSAAVLTGGILGGGNSDDLELLAEFSCKLGLAFQICDDLLDTLSSEAELGKTIGKDERDNKKTYVTALGIEKASERLSELGNGAKIILFKLEETAGVDTSDLRRLTDDLETRRM